MTISPEERDAYEKAAVAVEHLLRVPTEQSPDEVKGMLTGWMVAGVFTSFDDDGRRETSIAWDCPPEADLTQIIGLSQSVSAHATNLLLGE